MSDSAEEGVRSAVELAGGSMKVTAAALLARFDSAAPADVQAALESAGLRVAPLLTEARPEDHVVVYVSAEEPHELLPSSQGPVDTEPVPAGPSGPPLGRDVTFQAARGDLAPVIGREREIAQLGEILGRKLKRGVLLVGPPGVGKTAIVEGFAQEITAGRVPDHLQGTTVLELSPAGAISAAPDPASLATLTHDFVVEARESNWILFIDDFHVAVDYGGPELGIAGHVRRALAQGELACIGALPEANYYRVVQSDPSFDRHFDVIRVSELSADQAVDVLRAALPRLAGDSPLDLDDEFLRGVVRSAEQFLPNRYLPDKALDLLDRVIARARIDGREPNADTVADVLTDVAGVPVDTAQQGLAGRMDDLAAQLRDRVIGQAAATDALADRVALKMRRLDLRPERPNGVFLLTGPTGVGKTETARALAEFLFGSSDRMLRLDMSEHSEQHHVSHILGAPPGYVGFEQGSPVLEQLASQPFSVVLLDEVEKAHPAIHRLFLQVFDDGFLTTAAGRRVYFSDAIVVMTANLDLVRGQRPGFAPDPEPLAELERLDDHFPREFVNRIDAICRFRHLEPPDIKRILRDVMLPRWLERQRGEGLEVEIDDEVLEHLASTGYSKELGARELERVVEDKLLTQVAAALDDGGRGRLVARMDGGRVRVGR